MVDTIKENAWAIFEGIKKSIRNIGSNILKFIKGISKKLKGKSDYFWAFIIGQVDFEIVIDAVLAYFTGGVSIATKISRLSTKVDEIVQNGIRLTQRVGRNIATNSTQLLQWIKRELLRIIEALKTGQFIEYLRWKLNQLFDFQILPAQIDFLENHWDDKLRMRRRGGRRLDKKDVRIDRFFGQKLLKKDIQFLKSWLLKKGLELRLFPELGEYVIEGFINKKGLALKLRNGKTAAFVTNGKSKVLILRKGTTLFEFLHEYTHFLHSQKIGIKNYYELGDIGKGKLIKEKFVFDFLMENKEVLNKLEIKEALRYINAETQLVKGGSKTQVFLEFDIDKIPEVRKFINFEIFIKQLKN